MGQQLRFFKMSSSSAPIKWAQRSDSLYITIALPDVTDETINLTDTELHFSGKSVGKEYKFDCKFFKAVDAKASTYNVLPRSVQMHLIKATVESSEDDKEDTEEEWWPRLLEDKKLEKNQIKVDWNRYVDEDEEEEAGGFDMAGMGGGMPGGMGGGMPGMGGGMPGMGGMGGMPGMGGPGGPGGGMGGMDMEALMKQMGGMGGAPGMGGMPDMSSMPGDDGADSDDGDEDADDDLPDLEDSEASK